MRNLHFPERATDETRQIRKSSGVCWGRYSEVYLSNESRTRKQWGSEFDESNQREEPRQITRPGRSHRLNLKNSWTYIFSILNITEQRIPTSGLFFYEPQLKPILVPLYPRKDPYEGKYRHPNSILLLALYRFLILLNLSPLHRWCMRSMRGLVAALIV